MKTNKGKKKLVYLFGCLSVRSAVNLSFIDLEITGSILTKICTHIRLSSESNIG